jgi:hypothetical protein
MRGDMEASVSSGVLYSLPYMGLTMHMPRRFLPGNKERDKIVVEEKVSETTHKLNQFWCETGQAVVQSSFEVQNRSIQYAQNCFTDAVETLKSHIDASQQWMHMANRRNEQQEALPSLMESGIEAYKRNVALLQRITERGTETFRTNAEVVRDLAQTVMKKAQDQHYMFF